MISTVLIGMGSNLGDREGLLLSARTALSRIDAVAVVGCSSLYDTAPVGPPQPRFLNAVVAVECSLGPRQLLAILQQIETDLGRVTREKWGPRPIDLDLLLWGNEIISQGGLQIPHLELHKRRFALEPLLEIAPDAVHPLLHERLADVLARLPKADIVRYPAEGWPTPEAAGA